MQPAPDAIHIEKLEVSARIGVSKEERANPQRLVLSITLFPQAHFDQLADEIAHTVDYVAVARAVRTFVGHGERKLIETLASAVAAHLLASFPLKSVRVEVRKFVIPQSEYVAVVVTRSVQ